MELLNFYFKNILIIDAGSSYMLEQWSKSFKTQRFEVKIEEVECTDIVIDLFDESIANSVLKQILAGEVRYFDLKVTIEHIDSGLSLGTDYLFFCTELKSKPTTVATYRNAVIEAISQARDTIDNMALAA